MTRSRSTVRIPAAIREIALHHSGDTRAMRVFRTEINIQAPADLVWGILTDFRSYERWNPFIRRIHGQISVGSPLDVTLALRGRAKVTQRHVVLRADDQRELRWRYRICLPGVFDVQHGCRLDPMPNGVTRLRHSHALRGTLAELLGRRREAALTEAMIEMNTALKMRAERAHRASTVQLSPAEQAEQAERTTRLNSALSWQN
jgi:hypothetical protein